MAAPIRGEEPSAPCRFGQRVVLGCIALSRKSLRHIIDNLMLNVLRYVDTTPECYIVLSRHNPQTIEMVFINGAEGLPSQSHPLRFDRFFRVS